jgi:protein arginine kinase activator
MKMGRGIWLFPGVSVTFAEEEHHVTCDRCDNEATIHLTQVLDGKVKKVHLCEACAKEQGFDINETMSVTDLLLGKPESGPLMPMELSSSCPSCHMTRADFKKTGRLGCPDCYTHFAEGLAPLLDAVQRGSQHVGKIPSRESVRVQKTAEMSALQRELDKAIAEERYEDAAALRDRIKSCEQAMATQPGDQAE